MPTSHATLSPSAAARWITCPASIRLAQQIPAGIRNQESAYAREGTLAHSLAEIEAAWRFNITKDERVYAKRRRA